MKRLLTALSAVLLLSACGVATHDDVASDDAPTASPTASVDLNELRLEYGLPECPETDPDAESIDGGLPQTALPCLGSDQTVNLAGLAGEPMVINFWAQWCGPCREESPYLREASQASDVAFVGINYQDPQADWAIQFAGLVEWMYPHIQDQERELQAPLRIPGLPSTLFVTADGRVAGRHAGPFESTEQLVEMMDQYLGQS